VRVSLEGGSGAKVERELHVDTGADYLVLPQSLVSKLGIDKNKLESRDMQTANGRVKAQIGTLPALWLGGSRIADVETAFIGDKSLGENGLLGMSVLRRYKLTIDDDKNRITLGSKGGDAPPAGDQVEAMAREPEEGGESDSGDSGDETP
jgi:aspartyl protease family protein